MSNKTMLRKMKSVPFISNSRKFLNKVFKKGTSSGKDKQQNKVVKTSYPPMPEKEKLTEEFNNFLEKMSMPQQTKEKMRALPDENKWLLICQSKIVTHGEEDSVDFWLKKLKEPNLTAETLRKFKVIISSKDMDWLRQLVEKKVILVLIDTNLGSEQLMRQKSEAQFEIEVESLRCIKSFMNSDFGLKVIMDDKMIIEKIARWITSKNEQTIQIILDILTVICWVSNKGHKMICDGLESYQSESEGKTPFSLLVAILRNSNKHFELKTSVMTFLNVIINSFHKLEQRMFYRVYLIDEDILEIIKHFRSILDQYKSNDTAILLNTQYDVFEREYSCDLQEAKYRDLDLSDPDAIWSFLRDSTKESGFSANLIDTIKYFLIIPESRKDGRQMWSNCQFSLRLATSWIRKDEQITEHLKECDKNDDKKVWRDLQIKNAHENFTRLLQFDEIEQLLRDKIKKAPELIEKQEISDEAYEKLRKEYHDYKIAKESEIDSLKKNISSQKVVKETNKEKAPSTATALAPPPPLNDVAAPAVSAPPPLNGATATVGPPPPLSGSVPAPPPLVGAPPPLGGPPPLLGAPPLGGAAKPFLPDKPNPAPNIKMKNFHWGVLMVNNIKGTVWQHINDDNISIDKQAFEDLFQAKATFIPKKKDADSGTKTQTRKPTKEIVALIDSKRSTNIEIALSRFKMSSEAIRDSILEMDEKNLDLDKIQKLLALVPTSEEVEVCMSFDGDAKQLGTTEKFFRAVGDIKGVKARLEIFAFKQQFKTIYGEVMDSIKTVQNACDSIKNSKNLEKFLSIILKHGNYMNGGTKKGGAYGFKLSSLKQLNSTKSLDNTITLLQFIYHFTKEKYPGTEKFINDLDSVHNAVRIESSALQADVNKIKANVNKLGNMLKTASSDPRDRFKPVMEGFFQNAADQVADMHSALTKAQKDADALSVSYGEISGKMKWEDLFKVFDDFCTSIKNAELFWLRRAENEAREKRQEQFAKESKERLAKMKAKREKEKVEGGAADNVLANLRQPASLAIAEEIRKRRLQKTQIEQ